MKNNKETILFDSDSAAIHDTRKVTGWFGVQDGKFYGDDEKLARIFNSNHKKCSKNPQHPIIPNNSYGCSICHEDKIKNDYNAMPKEEWDLTTPIVITHTDQYFFDKESLLSYCELKNIKPSDLMLVICEPNFISEIDESELYEDIWYDGATLSQELTQAFKNINELIRKEGAVSWSEGKTAVIIPF